MKHTTLNNEGGYVLMSAAKPISFSFDEDELRLAALSIAFPGKTGPNILWTQTGKLLLWKGWRWYWTGHEVLSVHVIGA